ncbi:MAG: patatin-like phospholipase family protein [Candidatus Eremiobacteraeota bacterium]|nr:patatin-like phospholipase family protein [Candidatus Eremiobacteraeota bacterium]
MANPLRLGIVLTGGGARAAYHVGVVRALTKFPVEVTAISAVGSGALNGAILAGSAVMSEAVDRMAMLWAQTVLSPQSALRLGPIPVLRLGVYLTLLYSGGVNSRIAENLKSMTAGLTINARRRSPGQKRGDEFFDVVSMLIDSLNVSTNLELEGFIAGELRTVLERPVRPFFVSVYETEEGFLESLKLGLQGVGLIEADPVYYEVSSPTLTAADRIRYVLASATLPFLCESKWIGGHQYIDGSFGGMKRSPGAVPLRPLQHGLPLDAIFVVHTEHGVSWDATDFPELPILELRPSIGEGDEVGYFWADAGSLRRWMAAGERDATRTLLGLFEQLSGWCEAQHVRDQLRLAAEWLDNP